MKNQLGGDRPDPARNIMELLAMRAQEAEEETTKDWLTNPKNPLLLDFAKNINSKLILPSGTKIVHPTGVGIVLGPYPYPYKRTGALSCSRYGYGYMFDTEVMIMSSDDGIIIMTYPMGLLIPLPEDFTGEHTRRVVEKLKEVAKRYNERYEFSLGDKVCWKKDLEVRKMRGTFIFLSYLEKEDVCEFRIGKEQENSAEIMDCTIAVTLHNIPTTYTVDSRYLEPTKE